MGKYARISKMSNIQVGTLTEIPNLISILAK